MRVDAESVLDARYRRRFGRIAGYLPKSREAVDDWLRNLKRELDDARLQGRKLGYFSYGGSSMCLVFQPGAIAHFTVPNRPPSVNPDDGPPIQVNAQIAVAR